MSVRRTDGTPLADHSVRERIRTDFESNLFITAGAGTGKTRSIVDRVVYAVCRRRIEPRRIAVMTYTEKAAEELLFRIRRGLEAESPEKAALLPEMFIGTIHSFCLTLLRERPLESRIDPRVSIMTQEEADAVQEEIGRDVVREHLKELSKRQPSDRFTDLEYDPFSAVSFFLDLRRFEELAPVEPDPPAGSLWETHSGRMAEIPRLIALNTKPDPAGLSRVQEIYRRWCDLGTDAPDAAVVAFGRGIDLPKANRNTWSRAKWTGDSARSVLSFIEEILEAVQADADLHTAYPLYRAYRSLYDRFLMRYRTWKQEHSRLDFNDMILDTRRFLRTNREAREHFRTRFDLLVVDEFQDTDPVMAEILVLLCREPSLSGQRECRWDEASLTPGKLTVVGDPKQSIYRFRRADIGVYLTVRTMFEERHQGEVLRLETNFRSREPLIRTFNGVFPPLFRTGNGTGSQTAYEPVLPGPSSRVEPSSPRVILLDLDIDAEPGDDPVYSRGKRKNGLKAEHKRPREARTVAAWIRGQVENRTLRVKGRPVEYGDFLLLFRKRRLMAAYARALSALGVPASMDGEGFLLELPETTDLFRYIRGCLHPEDRVDVIGALRSAFGGISDRQLYEHAKANGSFSIFSEDGSRGIEAVRDALVRMKTDNGILSSAAPARAFRRFFARNAVRELLAHCRRLYGIRVYEALLVLLDEQVPPEASPAEAADALWKLVREGRKLDPRFVSFGTNSHVRMLTVHRAKGLQAPIVVLCDVSDGGQRMTPEVIPDRSSDRLYFSFELAKRTGGGRWGKSVAFSLRSAGFERMLGDEEEALQAEEVRLAYVAATRAEDFLVIPEYREKPGALYDGFGSGLTLSANAAPPVRRESVPLPPEIGGPEFLPPPDILAAAASPEADCREEGARTTGSAVSVEKRAAELLQESREAAERIARAAAVSVEQRTFSRLDLHTLRTDGYGPRYGSFFHRIMQLFLAALPAAGPVSDHAFDEARDRLLPGIIRRAALELDDPPDAKLTEARSNGTLQRHLDSLLSSPAFRGCLAGEYRTAEYPLSRLRQYGEITVRESGNIDLLYRKDGKWTIIDYKTNKIATPGERSRLEAEYAPQLAGYVQAFSTLTGEPAEGVLVFVDETR